MGDKTNERGELVELPQTTEALPLEILIHTLLHRNLIKLECKKLERCVRKHSALGSSNVVKNEKIEEKKKEISFHLDSVSSVEVKIYKEKLLLEISS